MELLDSLNELEEKIEQGGNSKIDITISEMRNKLEELYKKSLSPEERLFRTLQRLIAITSIGVGVSEKSFLIGFMIFLIGEMSSIIVSSYTGAQIYTKQLQLNKNERDLVKEKITVILGKLNNIKN